VKKLDALKVLFVDDEIDFLETLMKRMKKRGVDVAGVGSGEEALDYLYNQPVDVVVLDVRMPGIGGINTLREIKKIDPLMEVIMLTGHASIEAAIEGMESGAFDYLMKPADFDELFYKLQDAFKRRTIQKQKIEKLGNIKLTDQKKGAIAT
jgi:DNA-binding NtrC family response regulator